jgi:hypothetical protein
MAVTLVTTTMAAGVNYTVVTDTSADWASVANSTYFYDKADKLVHYKDSTGTIQEIFTAAGVSSNIYTADGTILQTRIVNLNGNDLYFEDSTTNKRIEIADTLILIESADTDDDGIKPIFLKSDNVSLVRKDGKRIVLATDLLGPIVRSQQFQDKNGILALLSDIPPNSGQNIYNSDGTLTGNRTVDLDGNTINFNDGKVGVNITPAYPLHIKSTAIPSTNENIVRIVVSDAPDAYLGINNGSLTDGIFVPEIKGRQSSLNNQPAIIQGGFIDTTQDSGTNPVTVFRSALANLTEVVTRPIFAFRNWTTAVMTILANGNVGIGTTNPSETLHISGDMLVENTNGSFKTDIQDTEGPGCRLSGNSSGISRIGVIVPSVGGVSLGVRGPSALSPGYGKQGDGFIYSSTANNGLNLISNPGIGTDDYIRFYAGSNAIDTPDIHIQGVGVTRGYVGIGTETPSEKLEVNGKTKTTNFQMTTNPTEGYVLTSDANGNGSWLGQIWKAPVTPLFAFVNQGATLAANPNGAGAQYYFSATADNQIQTNITLDSLGVAYDGSDLKLRISWQLFNTNPSLTDTVVWRVRHVFVTDGEDADSKVVVSTNNTISVVGRLPNQLYTDDLNIMTGLPNAKLLFVGLSRLGSAGSGDTYTNTTDLFGVELVKL